MYEENRFADDEQPNSRISGS